MKCNYCANQSEIIVQTPPMYAEMFKKKGSYHHIFMKLHVCGNLSFED